MPRKQARKHDHQRTINAPNTDTLVKSLKVLRKALLDTRNPVPRVSFSLSGTRAVGWHGGQQVYVDNYVHGLYGRNGGVPATDLGPWAGTVPMQPLGVAKVTTTFDQGGNVPHVVVEAGYRRTLYSG